MPQVIQFGIPSLDELIGRRSVTTFAPDELNGDRPLMKDAASLDRIAKLWEWQRDEFDRSSKDPATPLEKQWRSTPGEPVPGDLDDGLLLELLNRLVAAPRLFRAVDALGDVEISDRTWELLDEIESQPQAVHRLNRLLLEDAFAGFLPATHDDRMTFGVSLGKADESVTRRSSGSRSAGSTSVCIIGPEGTGKSVLALHLASRYRADFGRGPRILYASTDLSFDKAWEVWRNFALHWPNKRHVPFYGDSPEGWKKHLDENVLPVELKPNVDREDERGLLDYLLKPDEEAGIGFINLAANTAGDDWGFLNRVLAALPDPGNGNRHLLIIDAVEGLETFVGERDAFGLERSRRSRVAQIIRSAAGKCHVALTVEEEQDGKRQPEEFITDVVLQLRRIEEVGHARITVEVVKARGQSHQHGQHDLLIRGGRGGRTGEDFNPDDPIVSHPDGTGVQGYVHVCPSLHSVARDTGRGARNGRSLRGGTALMFALLDVTTPGELIGKVSRMAEGVERVLPSVPASGSPHKDESGISGRFLSMAQPPLPGSAIELTAERLGALISTSLDKRAVELEVERDTVRVRVSPGRLREVLSKVTLGAYHAVRQVAADLLDDGELAQRAVPPLSTPGGEEARRLFNWRLLLETYRDAGNAGFGIAHLDYMLVGGDRGEKKTPGLPSGTLTTIIGDDGTHKSRLGRAFLSGAFRRYPGDHRADHEETSPPAQAASRSRFRQEGVESAPDGARSVAVLITTQDLDAGILTGRMRHHLSGSGEVVPERVLCRRLTAQGLNAAQLFHIVRSAVEEAKRLSRPDAEPADEQSEAERRRTNNDRRLAWRWGQRVPLPEKIRVVIDDWSLITAAYPAVAGDPLFLPALTSYLERERVSGVIIDTQPGGPTHIIQKESDSSLRALVPHHLYTWNVEFYGQLRIAIAAIPPIHDKSPTLVRELRPGQGEIERLQVDPRFELYMDLEREPRRVPLKVHLVQESSTAKEYLADMERACRHLFQVPADGSILQAPSPDQPYEDLRDLCYLRGDARADHTLVLQVDEYWSSARGSLEAQETYLLADTRDISNDTLQVFETHGKVADPETLDDDYRRFRYFYVPDREVDPRRQKRSGDRVPYTWDFGFLLCRYNAWERAGELKLSNGATVSHVWKKLPVAGRAGEDGATWREVLEASVLIARQTRGALPFDLAMESVQSLACLVLEVWSSEVGSAFFLSSGLSSALNPKWKGGGPERRQALYRALLLLAGAGLQERLQSEGWEFAPRSASPLAVTARHWYSTGCKSSLFAEDDRVPAGLPGRWSSRGDWYLAVGAGSRSPRLGAHAIDLFSSIRANLTRLHAGIGLPTRNLTRGVERDVRAASADDQDRYSRARASLLQEAGRASSASSPTELEVIVTAAIGAIAPSADGSGFDAALSNLMRDAAVSAAEGDAETVRRLLLQAVAAAERQQKAVESSTEELVRKVALGHYQHLRLPLNRFDGQPATYADLLRLGAKDQRGLGREDFSWLWRSGISGYGDDARVLVKWLHRVLTQWPARRAADSADADDFTLFDALVVGSTSYTGLRSWEWFDSECDFLIELLTAR